jgi:hypothetical protein
MRFGSVIRVGGLEGGLKNVVGKNIAAKAPKGGEEKSFR